MPALREILILPGMILVIVAFLYLERKPPAAPVTPAVQVPDFAGFANVKEKKQAFFAFMLPLVNEANRLVLLERRSILALEDEVKITGHQLQQLKGLTDKYRVDQSDAAAVQVSQLLKRVDIIPADLALAQAANESAWGTSRFARQGNNYYGIWCFTAGCGAVPAARDENARHEVTHFTTIQDGVNHYVWTLNTHPAYEGLRTRRANLRQAEQIVSGEELVEGLLHYSERREAYVDEISAMIRTNQLAQLSQTQVSM